MGGMSRKFKRRRERNRKAKRRWKMRYVTVPEDVKLIDRTTGKPVRLRDAKTGELGAEKEPATFYAFLAETVLGDEKLGKTAKDVIITEKLYEKFASCKPGNVVELESEHWEKLNAVIETPTVPYSAAYASQVTSFLKAVMKAPEEDPRKAAKSEG